MNVKKLAALALLSAIVCSAGPAVAATGTVTVKWNTQKSAAIVLYTQTTASQTSVAPAANDMYQGGAPAMGAAAGCNGLTTGTAGAAGKDGSGGNGAWVTGTVNFGNVTPDGVNYTNCLETNAVEAFVTTNDSLGVNITVQAAGVPATYDTAANGSLLCILPDGTWNTGSPTAWTTSARAATVAMNSTTACSSGTAVLASSATSILNSTVAGTQDLNSDLQLNLGPNSTTGSVSATLTYTVTPN